MSSFLGRPTRLAWAFGGVFAVTLCFWLSAAVMPALADGGPHVSSINSGSSTLTADSCAGCHRAHSGQGAMLLKTDEQTLCVACHGQTGQGATTNVEGGVQFAANNDGTGTGAIAGALRGGGFVTARIDSAHSSRISYPYLSYKGYVTFFSSLVKVLAGGAPATSAHLDLDGANGVVAKNTAWGNGALNSGAGPTVEMSCTSCHDPHGNGSYRILAKIPSATGANFVESTTPAVVDDAAVPSGSGALGIRNYTIQWGRTLKDVLDGTYNDGTVTTMPDPTAGDYWRRWLPWDGVPGWDPSTGDTAPTGHDGDVPMYIPGDANNLEQYQGQIASWCLSCHTRYFQSGRGASTDNGDSIFRYRHTTTRTECTQCHVSHGSNASMDGVFSGPEAYPGGTPATSYTTGSAPNTVTTYYNSRLLKIDNRGTCQSCHDPTNTIPYTGNYTITH